jgi:long-subunit acyl-CoA synthetase (AMP-forming)
MEEIVDAAPQATTLCEAFQATAAHHSGEVALRTADGSLELTFAEYAARVRRIAAGLSALGVRRGDTVALLMSNRPEFHLCDTAAVHLGATPFSVYSTLAPEQIAHLFANAGNRVVIAERGHLDRIRAARGDSPEPGHLVCVDGAADGAVSLTELEELGDPAFDFEGAWRAVEPADVLTLIYTSGTTGPPKGVEITHANMLAECRAVAEVLPIRPGARITSYLPSAHIADRWSAHYNQMVFGIQVTSVPDPRAIAAVLPALRPTVWGAVPRVVEKLKAALEAAIAADPDEQRRDATRAAIEVGIHKVRLEQDGEPVPDEIARQYALADERVLSRLRARIGLDQAEWILIGAAPLARSVHEFLLGIGLPVAELYGMSECSCVVTACPPGEIRVGSVGRALPGVELRLAGDGELLVRGPVVMRGYRGQPEQTAEAVDPDGWMHTGDIATIDEHGHVRIVDRKKELIINAAGKNMSPSNIEQQLKAASPLIGQCVVIGDARPYNVALLVLDPDSAAAHARAHGLPDPSVEAVAADPEVRRLVAAGVEEANARLSRVEQIKRFELLAQEWLPGGDELTPTMKLKRKPIAGKYAATIDGLYAG